MSAIANAILAGHAASIRLHARGNYRMGALECLVIVQARLPGSRLDGRMLYVGEQHVATSTADDSAVLVRYATVFDGFRHCTPAGCDTSVTRVDSHRYPVERVLKAIEERQAARAKSLPVPQGDAGRDPEDEIAELLDVDHINILVFGDMIKRGRQLKESPLVRDAILMRDVDAYDVAILAEEKAHAV